jgi:anti-anti-sigma factor
MSLSISHNSIGDRALRLDLNGELILGEDATGKLRAVLQACASQGWSVHIGMSGVTRMDAAGIGTLVGAYADAVSRGTTVELGGLSPRLHHLLSLTKLLTVFGPESCKKQAA